MPLYLAIILFTLTSSLLPSPLTAQNTGNKPAVGLTQFQEDVRRTLELNLELTGQYQVSRISAAPAPADYYPLCRDNGLDYLIAGRLSTPDPDRPSRRRFEMNLYNAHQQKTVIQKTASMESVFDLFSVADQTAQEVMEEFSGGSYSYGTLVLQCQVPEGASRSSYQVRLDGISAGTDIQRLPRLLSGKHRLSLHTVSIGPLGFAEPAPEPFYEQIVEISPAQTTEVSFDLPAGKAPRTIRRKYSVERGHGDDINTLALSPAGGLAASGSDDRTVRIYNRETGRQLHLFHHQSPPEALSFSPDGQFLAVGTSPRVYVGSRPNRQTNTPRLALGPAPLPASHTIHLWNMETGQEEWAIPRNTTHLQYTPNGKYLLADSRGKTLLIDPAQGKILKEADGRFGHVHPRGGQIVCWGRRENEIILRSLPLLRETLRFSTDMEDDIDQALFSGTGESLITRDSRGNIRRWNPRNGMPLPPSRESAGEPPQADRIQPLPGRDQVLLGDSRQGIRPWPAAASESQEPPLLLPEGPRFDTFARESQTLLLAQDAHLSAYRIPDGRAADPESPRWSIQAAPAVKDLAFSPSGDYLALERDNPRSVQIWNTERGTPAHTFSQYSRLLWAPGSSGRASVYLAYYDRAYGPRGTPVAALGKAGADEPYAAWGEDLPSPEQAGFSPDGQYLYLFYEDAERLEIRTVKEGRAVYSGAFSSPEEDPAFGWLPGPAGGGSGGARSAADQNRRPRLIALSTAQEDRSRVQIIHPVRGKTNQFSTPLTEVGEILAAPGEERIILIKKRRLRSWAQAWEIRTPRGEILGRGRPSERADGSGACRVQFLSAHRLAEYDRSLALLTLREPGRGQPAATWRGDPEEDFRLQRIWLLKEAPGGEEQYAAAMGKGFEKYQWLRFSAKGAARVRKAPPLENVRYVYRTWLSPGENAYAEWHYDENLYLWSWPEGRLRAAIVGQEDEIAFSPAGDTLAFAGKDGIVGLLDLKNYRVKRYLAGFRTRGISFPPTEE